MQCSSHFSTSYPPTPTPLNPPFLTKSFPKCLSSLAFKLSVRHFVRTICPHRRSLHRRWASMWMFISPYESPENSRASQTGDSRKAQAVLPGDTGERECCHSSLWPNLHVRATVTPCNHAFPRLWLPLQLLRERRGGWGVSRRRSDEQSQPH